MANIGDKAAAHGLAVWAATQDRRLGYQNDNQRGDELADLMDRVSTVEANAKTPSPVQNATPNAVQVGAGKSAALTSSFTVAKVAYARTVRINWRALVVAASTGDTYLDVTVIQTLTAGDTQLTGGRIYGKGDTGGSFEDSIPANTAVTYKLVGAASNGSASVAGDNRFTQLQATARAIA